MAKKKEIKYRPINIRLTVRERTIIDKKAKDANRSVSSYCKLLIIKP